MVKVSQTALALSRCTHVDASDRRRCGNKLCVYHGRCRTSAMLRQKPSVTSPPSPSLFS